MVDSNTDKGKVKEVSERRTFRADRLKATNENALKMENMDS